MSLFTIASLSCGISCSILALIALIFGKTKIHRMLALFNAAVAVWGFGAFLVGTANNPSFALISWRLAHIGVIFIPVCFFHIVCMLTGIGYKLNKIVIFAYFQGVIFLFLDTTSLFIFKIKFVFNSIYYTQLNGIFYALFFFIWISLAILGHYELVVWYKRGSDVEKNQILYFFIGMLIGFLGGATNFFPMFGVNIYPFGNFGVVVYCVIISYAILHHRLLDIEVVIKKTFIFASLFTVVYVVFAFFALLGQVFFERFVTQNRWISMMPSVLVVTIMLRPLENFLIAITDKYLFQKRYDYKELLNTFTSEVLTVLELDKLIRLTEEKLVEIMKLSYCRVEILRRPALGGTPQNDEELRLPIEIASSAVGGLAMTGGTRIIGSLLLGKKKSDEDYTQEDLDILQPLTKTLGVAISNAKLFDELMKTHAKMAEKDKMATIGTLAAGMAHEIRNPITTIRNFADYLPEKYNDNVFISKFEKLIPREIDRIESIARSLLEFSSGEGAGEKEEFAIDEPMKTVVAILEPQYRASGVSVLCNEKEKHIVKANKVQLQDAFFNILNYIFAEIQENGKIVIECATGEDGLTVYIRSKNLVVADHIIKDVFEPISGLYKERRGFGFNLFIAKELIERNGATLKISSDAASGSEFIIEFK